MDVLSSRMLIRPTDLARSQEFYRERLGLAVSREFGPPEAPGVVFFTGNGLLEVSGHSEHPPGPAVRLWLQVRDARAEVERLRGVGVPVAREARTEPWGLIEASVEDPDGVRIVLVEVPDEHPLRRDTRGAAPARG